MPGGQERENAMKYYAPTIFSKDQSIRAWSAVHIDRVDDVIRSALPATTDNVGRVACAPVKEWVAPVVEMDPRDEPLDLVLVSNLRKVVSLRVREVLERVAPGEFQFLPVVLVCKGQIIEATSYWIVNPVRCIDCINLTSSKAYMDDYWGQFEFLNTGKDVFDPSAIPPGLSAFAVRFRRNDYLVVDLTVRDAIDALNPKGVFWRSESTGKRSDDPLREKLGYPRVVQKRKAFPEFPEVVLSKADRARFKAEFEQREAEKANAESFLLPLIGKAAVKRVEIGPPATAAQVAEFEALTGQKLPRLFKDFLRICGRLETEGPEILGVPARHAPEYGALRCTRDLQEMKDMAWPKHLLVIGEDGRGGHYCLDLSKSDGQDCPVVYHDHELDDFEDPSGIITPSIEKKSPSFEKWLKRVVRGQM